MIISQIQRSQLAPMLASTSGIIDPGGDGDAGAGWSSQGVQEVFKEKKNLWGA